MNNLFLSALCLISLGWLVHSSYAMEEHQSHLLQATSTAKLQALKDSPILTVDHDDVINVKNKMSTLDYARYAAIVARIAWHDPYGAASLLWNWRAIKNRGMAAAERVEGTSNIIYSLAQELKAEGYPDLTPYVEEMTAITVKPTPIWQTINYLKELKARGYTIIGATNQDYYQNKYFRERMEAQGIKFNEFFDSVMVAHTILKAHELNIDAPSELVQLLDADKQIFMPTSENGTKPRPEYYAALKVLAHTYTTQAQCLIHTDDKIENIEGAQKSGFKGAYFQLPEGKSARRCTPAELDTCFKAWQEKLESTLHKQN